MKKIKHQTILEFTYGTEEERLCHIELMELAGWSCNRPKQMKLKHDVSIYDAKDEDYEWYAEFWQYHPTKNVDV